MSKFPPEARVENGKVYSNGWFKTVGLLVLGAIITGSFSAFGWGFTQAFKEKEVILTKLSNHENRLSINEVKTESIKEDTLSIKSDLLYLRRQIDRLISLQRGRSSNSD